MDYGTKGEVGMDAQVERGGGLGFAGRGRNVYKFECFDKHGNLKWVEEVENLIVTEGLNHELNTEFKSGAQITTWYVGLIDAASFTNILAGDTAAQINGTNGWLELSEYDEPTREVLTLGTVSAGSVNNSASKASFTMNATKTVKGAFIVSASAKDATTGTLHGAAAFSGGDRAVNATDVLNVTATLTRTSS